jgi:uncharacterized protein YbjT (DUF2867 family)
MILVVGATGTNGREVVQQLSARGVPVRALVRSAEKSPDLRLPNVELVRGDLGDPPSLDAALRGVDRAFIVTAVDQRSVEWCRNFFGAAQRAGRPHVVKFSSMGAGSADTPVMNQHGETDELLRRSGLPYTILRPNSFYQNLLWSAGSIKDQGAFYLPLGDARQSLVDVRDLALVAAEALTGAGHEGQVYELTGPESLSYHDVAATLSKVLGKPVRYVPVSLEAARESMLKAGMPEWNAAAVTDLYRVFASGAYAHTTDTIARLTGRPPRTFEQFARDHAGAFQ